MTSPILSCTGIHKTFNKKLMPSMMLQDRIIKPMSHSKRWSKKVLDDVSLSLAQGEWVGIYGPNGAGKTTLLRILAGLLPPDEGTVDVHGTISCFFDITAGFHPERSAEENVYLHGLLHGRSPSDIRRSINDIMSFAGVESHRGLPMKCYSAGMNLRVGFAASALMDSDIYLFDEILAVGDADFQKKWREHLLKLKRAGKSVLLVNHDLPMLKVFCDRIVHFEDGTIVREEQVAAAVA